MTWFITSRISAEKSDTRQCTEGEGERQQFADAAAGLYAGTVSLADVLELVEEP